MPDRPDVVGRIFANAARLLGGKAGAGLISLGYLLLATRALGPHDYGVLVLVHGYVMLVGGIVEFPGWHAVVRYGAQALRDGDETRLARLIRFAAVLELACGALAVAITALLAPVVGRHLHWSQAAIDFSLPYSAAVLATVRATPAGYLQLTRRFDLLGVHNLLAPSVRLAGGLAAFAMGWGLWAWLWVWLAAALAEWFAMWGLGAWAAPASLRRAIGHARLGGVANENPGMWRFMLGANADATLGELAGRLSPLAVGWLIGPSAAGLVAVAQRATILISQPAQILGQAAFAELATLAAQGRHGEVLRTVLRASGFTLLVAAPLAAGYALFGTRIAVLFGGAAFAGAGVLMGWFGAARTLQMAGPSLSAALTALGRPWMSAQLNLLAALLPLLALPLLLPLAGFPVVGPVTLAQAALAMGLLAGGLALHRPGAAARTPAAA